jgi:hypothetical protein
MQRPSRLHWQPIRGSAWLGTAMLLAGLPPIAYSLARDWTRLADKSSDEAAHFIHQYMFETSPAIVV